MLRFRTPAKDQALALAFLVAEVFLLCLATAQHTLWRDEAQAWLLARDSPTVAALIYNLRYEGHPPLWHLLLLCFTKLTWNPLWMKALNLAFGIVAATVLLLSPSPRLSIRVGIALSYFVLFEYGVIARNYMVGLALLLLATCLLMRGGRSRLWAVPLTLALSALTSLPALILAVSLFGVYFAQETLLQHAEKGSLRLCRPPLDGVLASLLFCVCALWSVLLIRPPADTGVFLLYPPLSHNPLKLLSSAGTNLAAAYFPAPVWTRRFWDDPAIIFLPYHLPTLIGWGTLAGLALYLRRPTARLFFLVSSLLVLLQITVSQRRTMHNLGWLFVCFVIAIYLEDSSGASRGLSSQTHDRWRAWLLGSVLATQVFSGLFATAASLVHPFSHAKDVADLLRQHHLEHAPLVFEPGYVGSAVLAYLERSDAYSLELHRPASFIVWSRREFLDRHIPSPAEMEHVTGGTGPPVLITEVPLTAQQSDDLHVRLLARYNDAISDLDNYFIYR